ncbi:MAG TPA: hypothetical protein VFA46_03935 [Actinomycetes bacterium]|nr:hypothetical protein [Actinomycetes bacterium]
MAVKVVHVSDLSGKQVEESQLGRLVVVEHPDFAHGPVTLEVLPEEVATLKTAERFVHLEYYPPGARRPERLTVSLEQFNALAEAGEMNQILRQAISAEQDQRGRGQAATGDGRRGRARARANYATLERAGEPHRGRITDAEKRLVREHLDQINRRLRDQGLRQIDPSDPAMRQRYGLL